MFDSERGEAKNERLLEAIRIAAYFFKRLKKPQVQGTDISSSVDKILNDEMQMVTCRALGYLLLGIVRIYSKKAEYLLYDCQEVLLGINNFVVCSKKESTEETQSQKAPYFSITLPESYELDTFDVEVFDEDAIDGNRAPVEEITLKERGLENAGTRQHSIDTHLYEDIGGGYNPCSVMYSPFDDILSSYGIDVNLRKLLNIDGLTTTMELIQENRLSQRKCTDRVFPTPVEEEYKNVDATKTKDREISSSEQIIYAEVSAEMLRDSGGNDANHVESPEVEVVPDDDHVQRHIEDPLIDRDHVMVSEPEHLESEIEKLRDNTCSIGESVDPSVLCGPKEPRELDVSFVEENHEDGEPNLSEIPNDEECHNANKEDNSVSAKLSAADIKIPDASDVGAAMSQFVGLSTPAPKERARKSSKRKCIIDEAIVLPAKVIKRNINDASDLVSKRRKIADTNLAVWRAARSFSLHFFDPLLTGISPELRSLYYGKKLKMTKPSKTMAPLEKLDMSKIASPGISEQIGVALAPELPVWFCAGVSEQVGVVASETPVQCSAGLSAQIGIAPETPVQRSSTAKPFEGPLSPGTPNYESVRPLLFESPRRELSPSLDQQLDLNLTDEVTSSHCEDNSDQWDGWSGRTRLVAKYLRRSFQKLEERSSEETLNLSQVVERKTKKESAKLFYELLVLSSKGFVSVKQDESYGDILVRKLEKLNLNCGVDDE